MLVIAYGVARILSNVFNNLRDALFARVGQHAVRNLAYITFVHMHELSLRYPPAAPHRRLAARHRARRQRHRDDRPLHHPEHAADLPRVRFRGGHHRVSVRLEISRRRGRDDHHLRLVHGEGVGLAHQDTPRHERVRPGRALEGDRLAAQLRDGEIFRQREAGSAPLRPRHGALRERRCPYLDVHRLAQHRPDRDFLDRHHHLHGHVGAGGDGRHADHRRLRFDQRAAAATVDPPQFHRHGLSRDQAGADRHRGLCSICSRSSRRSSTRRVPRR